MSHRFYFGPLPALLGTVLLACVWPVPRLLAQASATAAGATRAAVAEQQTDAGELIDRPVAVVNGVLVMDSDVDEEQRLTAFEPYRDPGKDDGRDHIIERLINRDLILQQIKLTPETPVTDDDLRKSIASLRATIPACKAYDCATDAGWSRFLAHNGFTEAAFNGLWRQRLQVLKFIEERFRMGVIITPAQTRAYYQQTMLPQYARQGVKPPPLNEQLSSRISEVLLQQQVSSLLGDWLNSLRAQGSVVVLKLGEVAP